MFGAKRPGGVTFENYTGLYRYINGSMVMIRPALLIVGFFLSSLLTAQESDEPYEASAPGGTKEGSPDFVIKKSYETLGIRSESAPVIDGVISDPVWEQV